MRSEVFGLRGSQSAVRNPQSAIVSALILFSVLVSTFPANAATLEICEQESQTSDSAVPNPKSAIRNPKSTQKITGRVEDETGAVLPRALVEIRDREGKVLAKTHTNGRGEF